MCQGSSDLIVAGSPRLRTPAEALKAISLGCTSAADIPGAALMATSLSSRFLRPLASLTFGSGPGSDAGGGGGGAGEGGGVEIAGVFGPHADSIITPPPSAIVRRLGRISAPASARRG